MDEALAEFVGRVGPFPGRGVSVLGLGPGDPGLLTVKAAVRLRQAEVVFYDFGNSPWAIWDLVTPGAERTLVPCEISTGDIVAMIRPHVEAGRRVVYLVAGDPFVFERADAVAEALAAGGLAVEIVPGLTAAVAAAAYAGIPLTSQGVAGALCLAAGCDYHGSRLPSPILATMARSGILVLYVAEEHLDQLCAELRACGLAGQTPATLVADATEPSQRVVSATLDTIGAEVTRAGVKPPALVFIGAHAAPRPGWAWFAHGD
ncbi:MAG TPA: SAM-dependent methyltransferase [Phycisphaerae bacterium]|nr:SAM-dependent methyltransferase [Phycisphaerae bacterium]HNU46990.1 SAM-dependent methyltransferase [Phycisphaerae bacterium]